MTQQDINSPSMLRIGTTLRGIYRIDSYLSSGGFGNTYVATNIEFEERVAIKEFFMKGVTQRDGNQTTVSVSNAENVTQFEQQREKFKKEARRLRQLNNPYIVRVHDLFEENGTAYYVMDYVDGENLSDRLKRTGRPMTEAEVNDILPQILDALKSVHDAGIWHLDLKPANIMVNKSGQVRLIDFGASKQLNTQKGGATTSTAISYTNGYAPREQMEQNYDKFGPWTDIYALGATLYNLLTANRPPLPTDIDDDMSEDKHLALPMPNVSEDMKRRVLWMMNTNRMQRPPKVEAIIEKVAVRTLKNNSTKLKTNRRETDVTINDEETIISNKYKLPIKKKWTYIGNFYEGLAKVKQKNKWGFVDINHDIIIPLEYDWVGFFFKGLARVQKNGKEGLIDKKGNIIIPIEYRYIGNFHEGLARVQKNGKEGFVDITGNIVVPLIYDDVLDFSEGLARVQKNGKKGYIDRFGNIVIPLIYNLAGSFSGGLAKVRQSWETFYINKQGVRQ